jgi:hypothetical protein
MTFICSYAFTSNSSTIFFSASFIAFYRTDGPFTLSFISNAPLFFFPSDYISLDIQQSRINQIL